MADKVCLQDGSFLTQKSRGTNTCDLFLFVVVVVVFYRSLEFLVYNLHTVEN